MVHFTVWQLVKQFQRICMIVIHFRFQHTTFIQFTELKVSLQTTLPKA